MDQATGPAEPAGAGGEQLDPRRLEEFLRATLGLRGEMMLRRIAGGQSNPTFEIRYPERRLVLRKQPGGELLPSAHAIEREYRVLEALAQTDVPVPPAVLFHAGRDILDTPFYLMEYVPGRMFHDSALSGAAPGERRAMYFAAAETLARLHDVDWEAVGLDGFGRPGNYFARQIARWTKQWELARFRDIPDLARLAEWLPGNIPADDETTIVHGDYRMGNIMFAPEQPRVVAVLDWELSTLGHPLADVAFSCLAWHSTPAEYGGLLGLDLDALGIPPEADYLARYYRHRRRGHGSRVERFHLAFAMFRFAVIFEGIAARARAGTAAAANAAAVGDLSLAFARHGVALLA
jgi:aminoglycoside phosphotransferase (APT) family kinase protein